MVKRRIGLGRGLEALLSPSTTAEAEAMPNTASQGLTQLPLEHIRRGKYQPRVHMHAEGLEALADSIRAQGVMQPVLVRPVDAGYELIAGERRWRAAQMVGLETIPALIREIPDQAAAAMALIENIQREDLNPLEEAEALRRLIDEFSMTHQSVAEAIGRSRTAVSNLLRLLDLHEVVKGHLNDGAMDMGHARCLLALPMDQQPKAAVQVVEHQLSVRATEKLIRRMLENKGQEPARETTVLPEVRQLETRLSDTLGAAVQVRYNRAGKGKLVIEYNNLDELDGILAHIR